MKTLFVACLFLSGCTIEGQIDLENAPKVAYCKDTRDGETFSFHSSKVTDIRIGIASDTCFSVVDDAGADRRLCSSQEVYMKCGPKP